MGGLDAHTQKSHYTHHNKHTHACTTRLCQAAPGSYKCPVCRSPKSRFKAYKGKVSGRPNNAQSALKSRFAAREW